MAPADATAVPARPILAVVAATMAAVIASLVGLLLLLAFIVMAFSQTQGGRDTLASGIERLLTSADGSAVRIKGLGPGLPARLAVERIEVADPSGTWLAVDDLVLAWQPLALFAGRLHVDEISAATVDVSRLPPASEEPAADQTAGPPRLPSLPLAVRINRLGIDELKLAEAVAGRPMRLGIEGKVAAADGGGHGGGRLRTAVAVMSLDASAGALLLDADVDPAGNTFEIQASLDEPEGGLVGNLLGFPPRTPLVVRLGGRGPFDAWKGNVEAKAGGFGKLRSDLSLQWSTDLRLAIAGRADVEPALLPQVAPALADGLRFETSIMQRADGGLAVEALELAGEGIRAAGSGVIAADGALSARAELSLQKRALAAGTLDPLRFEDVDVQLAVTGSLQAPTALATASIEQPAGPGVVAQRLDVQARGALAPATDDGAKALGGAAEVTGSAVGLRLDQAPLQAMLGEAPRLTASAALNDARTQAALRSVVIEGRAVRITGAGTLSLEDQRLAAHADIELGDLRGIGAAAGLTADGAAKLAAELEGTLQPLALTGKLDAAGKQLATGIPALDALLGPEPRIGAPFSWSEQAGLDVPRLRLDGRNVSAEGSVRLAAAPAALDAHVELTVPSLAPLSEAAGTRLRGRAVLQATAQGNPADPRSTLVLRVQDAAVNDLKVPSATADLQVADVLSRPAGRLTLDGASELGPVSALAEFSLDDGRWLRLSRLTGRGLGIALDGAVQADLAGPLATGAVQVTSQSPQAGILAGGAALRGPINLDVRLAPEGGRQGVTASLNAGPLSLVEGEAEQMSLDRLTAEATVRDAFANPEFAARAQVERITRPARISSLVLTAEGTPAQARLTLAGEGEDPAANNIEAAADFLRMDDALRMDVDRLRGHLGGEAVRLTNPARIVSGSRGLSVSGLALDIGQGGLRADAELGSGRTVAALRAQSLPLGILRLVAPAAPARGTIGAELTLRTEQQQTVGSGSVRFEDVGFEATPGDARFDAGLDLALAGGALQVQGDVVGPENSRLTLAARLPARLPAGEVAPIVDRAAPLDGRLGIDADLGRLSLLLALADQRIEGRLAGDLAIGGSISDPRLAGGIDLRNGLYENFVSATLLNSITARIEPRDQRTLVLGLTGTDGAEGRVSAEGEATLLTEGGVRANFVLRADDATLVRRDDVTATLNAEIAYANDAAVPRLSGRIESREINIRLLDRLPPSVVVIPVTEIGQPRFVADQPGETTAPLAVDLDIAVSLPRRVFVRGRGLESEWSGNLVVAGTSAEPRITGEVALVRGTLTFAGKRFDLQRGVVAFTGAKKIDPLINAVAEYRSTEITAFVAITGLASQPEIEITSQPPLPESEVLSRVLFNKSSAKLGPVEAVQLAAALEALARGESTGENVFSFVRTLLGLDTLAVQPSRSGEGSSVAVGSYLSDQIYVGAEQGLEDGSKTGSVEIEIAPGISIESEIGQSTTSGTQGALGLKWKWDY